ncbi:MAG: DUF5694 domain-containing protein [Bacteroidia bacterium]|nr:DUF5694 domain-containing protein [Bacteroidia bacterium]
MRYLIIPLLLFFSFPLTAQKLDIYLLGSVHHFEEEYQSLQNLEEIENFIVELKPDIICIEAIPTYDTESLEEIWGNTLKKADRLRDSLEKSDFHSQTRSTDLILKGAAFYAQYDFWNAYYYWMQAESAGDSLGYFAKYHRNLKHSEYGLFVYPAGIRLGMDQYYPIDYRAGEKDFLSNNNKVLKKFFFSLKWKPLKSYLKTQKRYKKAQKEGGLMEYVNGAEFQDAFSQLIDQLPDRLPTSLEARDVKSYWLKRNEIMADRIIEQARSTGAQKVLLTVGSAHISHIKRFLEAKGHSVRTFGEILAQNPH